MTAAVIILSVILAVVTALFMLEKKELANIAKQLSELRDQDTNRLINGENGMADKLIVEINSMLKEIRETKAEYKKKNHSLEQMITNVSHDLRTPLTSAMGYIDLIQHSDLSEEEKRRELAIIENRLIRLQELINSFFELWKIISCGKSPERSNIDIVAVLEEAIVHYYDDYCGRDRQIVFNCTQRKRMVSSNRNMLLRIFDNLIGNALKHGEGDLTITVIESDELRITFENVPISQDIDTEHIFDEFYTTDISRTNGNTGLGLAIAKQFTEMLDGTISAALSNGKFILTVTMQ
ncbi:MAG: HAMP domain-containing histidine kinase [Ruminococcus sp.]|nr:HAMP domain-containing histidine kinase [Ruminococcus sp.]